MTQSKPRHQRSRKRQKRSQMPLILGGAFVAIIALVVVLVVMTSNKLDKNEIASIEQAAASVKAFTGQAGRTEDGFWYKGSPDAPVKVVEFADYECPACATMEQGLQQRNFDAKYIETGKVQYIYKEFPLPDAGHQWAMQSAEVARCSGDQDKFWPVHDYLFASQTLWASRPNGADIVRQAALQAGVNASELDACLAADTHLEAIQKSRESGQADHQVNSTPSMDVDGVRLTDAQQSPQGLIQVIDAQLAAANTN